MISSTLVKLPTYSRPDGLFGPVVARRYWVRIPAGSDVCYRGCAHIVFQTDLRPGVHYENPWKLLTIIIE